MGAVQSGGWEADTGQDLGVARKKVSWGKIALPLSTFLTSVSSQNIILLPNRKWYFLWYSLVFTSDVSPLLMLDQ